MKTTIDFGYMNANMIRLPNDEDWEIPSRIDLEWDYEFRERNAGLEVSFNFKPTSFTATKVHLDEEGNPDKEEEVEFKDIQVVNKAEFNEYHQIYFTSAEFDEETNTLTIT